MELNAYFKSIIEQDHCSVVICDLEHTIIYMNPAAIARYEKRGGAALVGRSLMNCHNPESNSKIEQVINWFKASPDNNIVHSFFNEKENKDGYMVALRDGEKLIGYYERHEYRDKDTTPFYDMK